MTQVLNRWLKRINELEVLTWNIRGYIRDKEGLNPLIERFAGLLEEHLSYRLGESLKELRQFNVPERGYGKMLEFLEVDGKLMLIETLQFFESSPVLRSKDHNGMYPKNLSGFLEKVLQRLAAERKAVESLMAYLDPRT